MKITKKWGKVFMAGMLGTTLIFGLLFSSCGEGGGGGAGAGSTGSTTTYTGSSSAGAVEITLTPQSTKSYGVAAIDYVDYVGILAERSVVSGTTYSYTIKIAGVIKSSGTARVSSVTLTFTSSSGKTFSATISQSGLSNLTIKPESGADITAASLTEAASGGGDDGTKIYGCTYTRKTDDTTISINGESGPGTLTYTHYYLSDTFSQAVSNATSAIGRQPNNNKAGIHGTPTPGNVILQLGTWEISGIVSYDLRIIYYTGVEGESALTGVQWTWR